MADTIIVGKFVGANALAAVGSTGTIMFLIIGFLQGMTAGFTVPTAQKFGAGDMKSVRKTVGSAAILSFIVSAIMTVISMCGMKWLLHFMNTPDNIFDDAYRYIMVICAGIFAQVLYNLLASILRALGNSKTAALLFDSCRSVKYCAGFGVYYRISHGSSRSRLCNGDFSGDFRSVVSGLYHSASAALKLTKDDWKLDATLVKIQFGIGFPMAFQYSITAIGAMMMQSSLNILGSVAIAGFTAASKIEQLVTQAYVALGTTMATYCAQNMGAGKILRIRQGFRSATWMGFAYAVVAGIFVMFAGKYLTPLFLSENLSQIMDYVDIYLKCVGLFFIPLTLVNVYRNGIQGMGFGVLPMMAGVARVDRKRCGCDQGCTV